MHPGRILGIVMGIAILAAIFILPFFNFPFTSGPNSLSLFGRVSPILSDIAGIQSIPDPNFIAFSYILIVAFILLVIAGIVGLFPLGTGVLGVVALALVTVAPLILVLGTDLPGYGLGYYVAWIASIVALAGSFWHKRAKQEVKVSVSPSD